MREIKFRAWNPKVGMSEIVSLEFAHGLRLIPADIDSGRNDLSDDKWVLMQFTGLKDKNGKEIYEGDVLELFPGSGGSTKKQVAWGDSGFVLRPSSFHLLGKSEAKMFEVISNIHENPELLK